jgi:hypothetical protein
MKDWHAAILASLIYLGLAILLGRLHPMAVPIGALMTILGLFVGIALGRNVLS